MLKQKLLASNFFEDNQYLQSYVQIIGESNELEANKDINYQWHHIIPSSCYKHKNQPVDNSDSNLVRLSFSDHVLAHYFLSFCLKNNCDKQASAFAFLQMSKRASFPLNFEELLIQLPEIQTLYNEFRSYMMSPQIRDRSDATHKQTCSSLEWRAKIGQIVSDHAKNNPYVWINNGIVNKRLYDGQAIPEGFKLGRVPTSQEVREKIRNTTIQNHKDPAYRENQSKKSKAAWENGCYANRKSTAHPAWNAELTKETSIKLKEIGERHRGFKMSDEARAKLSESHKGLKPSNSIKILCIETGIVYLSINDAEKMTGISCYKLKKALKDPTYLIDNKHWVKYQE